MDEEEVDNNEGDDDDDALIYDDDEEEEDANKYNDNDEVYIDEEKYPQNNAYTPIFDAKYPPVGEIVHLTDTQFKEEILDHVVMSKISVSTKSDVVVVPPLAEGVDGMLKRAMYAFVVTTLCGQQQQQYGNN